MCIFAEQLKLKQHFSIAITNCYSLSITTGWRSLHLPSTKGGQSETKDPKGGLTMKLKRKSYGQEDYELDNVYNEEDLYGQTVDSSIWYT